MESRRRSAWYILLTISALCVLLVPFKIYFDFSTFRHIRVASPKSPLRHPIDNLIVLADREQHRLLKSETANVDDAAAAYRRRRGRHPPPRFDQWVAFAQKHNALIIEEFFDQIYHDLEPFWALVPGKIREATANWPLAMNVRNGNVTVRQNPLSHVSGEWDQHWLNMLLQISQFLPDVDMPFNDLDEPRVSVPWETINDYMKTASSTRGLEALAVENSSTITSYPSLPPPLSNDGLDELTGVGPRWESKIPFWERVREACPPDSFARTASIDEDLSLAPEFPQQLPAGSYHGFVSNWTSSKSVCEHPHMRNMYGTFVRPRYNSINSTLIPLFSGCKMQGINNEILVPAAKYWSGATNFAFTKDEGVPWKEKRDQIIWRGQASGGRHEAGNWKRFHRHRFVAMLNGTEVEREEQDQWPVAESSSTNISVVPPPHNIPLPNNNLWDLGALKTVPSTLGSWVKPWADAGFVHFHCDPWWWTVVTIWGNPTCKYTDPYYSVKNSVKMSDLFKYKLLPDIDGNSYSGRFRAYMQSGSLPIKATMWAEWHDTRLLPWKHFVPMDNTFADWWAILEYLVGYGEERQGHDEVAQKIAEEGQAWSAKVLRNEDILVYVYRLVLEYARICSDERERMAFVDDLM